MVVTKENLSDLKEKYEKAIKLINEESKLDPITSPYRSAYASREILREIEHNLRNNLLDLEDNENNKDDIFLYKCILGIVLKELGRNYGSTEEQSEGKKYFIKSVELLEEYKLCPEVVIPVIEALNELSVLVSQNDAKTSLSYLDQAEDIYNEFNKLNINPLTIYDIFGTKDEVEEGKGYRSFENNYTLTLYFKAQVYTKLEDLHNSAWCCHKTLKRQLKFDAFEAIDWSLNAAILSQYFFSHNKFTESRHHLSAANLILDNFEKEMITDDMNEEQKEEIKEKFDHNYADLMRCWAKYGLYILAASKDRLMEEEDNSKNPIDIENLKIYSENLTFESLELESYESQITNKLCRTFDDAKPIFLKVQEWLNKAKVYYNSDIEATEHAIVVQDLSSAFKLLAFFEEDGSNQCKLHKRRADMLEEITKLYNPNFYLKVCREVWYELGLTYSNMLDIKLEILNDQSITERPTPHALNKINLLCDKSITNFDAFIDSYRNKTTKEIPEDLVFDELVNVLFAYFHVGRLYYKKITPDKNMQAININNSLKYYNTFVNKCSESKDAGVTLKAEIGVCREMIELLPRKLQILLESAD